ncbi:MAG: recombinase family protein [Selenomonas sp.]|nr:recombinase family protein [Selenomonas sp.]
MSTDWQAEHGYSLDTQVEGCVKLAKELGASTIQKYVDDGYSGAYLERPALDKLRDALQAKMFEAVVCYVPDRLARRLSHQLLLTEEIERSGASLHFVSMEFKDTPEGRLFYQMHGAFAEYEREKIRERTMRGKRGKLRSGKPINDSGVYGYDFDKKESAYTVNPAEAEIIRHIFQLYTVECIGGVDVISVRLKQEGIPSPGGKPYWHPNSVRRILTQPMYIGRYYSNKVYKKKVGAHKYSTSARPESEWIEMRCPPIIDEETFADAQNRLAKNRTVKRFRRPEDTTLIQGLVVCGKCGRKMGVGNNGRKTHRYYACNSHIRAFATPSGSCGSRYARTEIVDAAFWALLEKVCADPASLSSYIANVEGIQAVPATSPKEDIQARLSKISTEKEAVMEWFSKSFITQEDATKKLSKLKSEEEKLLSKLERLPKEEPKRHSPAELERICSAVASCPQDFLSRRRVIQSLIDSVVFERTDTKKKANDYTLKFKIHFR